MRISIRDYGCGIPFEVLPRIFDPYFSTKPGASSLGWRRLTAIITKHGGTLSVESKPGWIGFHDRLAGVALKSRAAAASATTMKAGTERILIMDDEGCASCSKLFSASRAIWSTRRATGPRLSRFVKTLWRAATPSRWRCLT